MRITWKEIAESIVAGSIVLSLLFVGYELRQSRSIAIFDGAIAAEESLFNLRSLQIENIDVWQRGCAGGELTSTENGIFSKIVDAVNFRNFTAWSRANLGLVQQDSEFFARGIAIERYNYPGFNDAWLENYGDRQAWGEWPIAVDSIYQALNDESVKLTPGRTNCG